MERHILEHMLDNLPEAIYILAPDGRTLYANNADAALFGVDKKTALTYNVFSLTEEGKTSTCILAKVLEHKKEYTAIQTFFTKRYPNGRKMMVTQRPIFDSHGEVKYSVGIIRDMEELTQEYQSCIQMANIVVPDNSMGGKQHLVCHDPVTVRLLREVDRVAFSRASVLITGESGVGKEVLAEYIHNHSRPDREMIRINCASLPENLLEAELFGYAKGAFTGALSGGRKGLMEMADKSTLFLDEINSMPMSLQGKLLRAIETKMVRPVGATEAHKVDFRLITATNEDLPTLVKEKRFRQDLYYRCNVISFEIPPLRERRGDIRPLCDHFLREFNGLYSLDKTFSEGLYQKLENYAWPGNVRELKNFVERAVLMTDYTVTTIDDVAPAYFYGEGHGDTCRSSRDETQTGFSYIPGRPLRNCVADYEQWLIEQAVREAGTVTKAAAMLGIDKSTLIRKRKKHTQE